MYFEETYNSKIYGFETLDDAFIQGPSEYYDGDNWKSIPEVSTGLVLALDS